MSGRRCNYPEQSYSHGSITWLNRLSLPVNHFLSRNCIHAAIENCKLYAVFVTILTIDALPTRPATAHRTNFAVLKRSDLRESADKILKVVVSLKVLKNAKGHLLKKLRKPKNVFARSKN